jgi:DNA helicase IV
MTFEIIKKDRPESIRKTAQKLRNIIFETLGDIDENIYGGKKVQNALYSKGDPNNVVCGIQTNDKYCLFYLHKTDVVNTDGLKLEGKGKHAKHVKFASAAEIDENLIRRVLTEIIEKG